MVGKEGSAWRVRGFLTPPGRSQPSARSRQNLRPRSEARNPETRANWALCRIVAQSRKIDPAAEEAVRLGGGTLGRRGPRGAQPGYGAVHSLRTAVHVSGM